MGFSTAEAYETWASTGHQSTQGVAAEPSKTEYISIFDISFQASNLKIQTSDSAK